MGFKFNKLLLLCVDYFRVLSGERWKLASVMKLFNGECFGLLKFCDFLVFFNIDLFIFLIF